MRNRALVVAFVAAWLVVPATLATAAAPWSEPVDLGPGTNRISGQLLDFAAAGTPQFTYSFMTAMPSPQLPSPVSRSAFARRRPDGTVIRDVLRDDMIAQARFGRRSWVVLRYRPPRGPDGRALLRVSTGTGPGELGAPQTLARYLVPDPNQEPATIGSSLPQIASGPSGNVAIIWTEVAGHRADGSTHGARIRLVYRLAGGNFSHPTTVAEQASRGALRNARLTFHGRSTVTIAYVRNTPPGTHTRRTLEARKVRLGGRELAPQTLGPAPESYNDVCIAAAPGGRTVVAWGNVHGTVMGARSRYTVRAALRAPNARRFAAAQVLDPGPVVSGAPGELVAGIADDGTATLAWSAYASTGQYFPPVEVRTATATATGRFAAPQVLTTSGHLTDLVVANHGAALATWTTADTAGNATIHTALRTPGATAFGAPETVAVVPLRYVDPLAPNPDAAFDPGTGRFGLIWATDDSTDTAPTTQIPGSARLLLATREAR
jgi:hypothetical protein